MGNSNNNEDEMDQPKKKEEQSFSNMTKTVNTALRVVSNQIISLQDKIVYLGVLPADPNRAIARADRRLACILQTDNRSTEMAFIDQKIKMVKANLDAICFHLALLKKCNQSLENRFGQLSRIRIAEAADRRASLEARLSNARRQQEMMMCALDEIENRLWNEIFGQENEELEKEKKIE